MSIKEAYTTQELAAILRVDARTSISRRATRESWQSLPRSGRGGGREWLLASMPEATRLLIASRVCSKTPISAPASRPSALAEMVKLKGKVRVRAEARVAVVLLARVFTAGCGLAFSTGMEAFAARYNAGEIGVEDWVREALPSVCRNSLLNWEKTVQADGVARLGGKYGVHRKGTGRIDNQTEVREVVLGMLTQNPGVQARLVLEKLHADFDTRADLELPSLGRLQRWIKQWKEQNADTFLRVTAPDKWKSRHRLSCGDAYELITCPNQRWEYDGTPADLMLNDGKRYTIVGIIDVYSRRLKLEVALRSTSRTVANLTYRCLVDWGVPEEAVTDNGKEFTARHMQSIFVDLEILPTILPPFRPELKPAIERVFHTFSHDLLSIYPCYVGHNVATRQEIRERNTFARRLMDGKNPAELSMALSPEQLQIFCDNWTDHVYAHRPHRGLKGRTPFEMQTAFEGEILHLDEQGKQGLQVLLLPPAGKDGWCTVTKEGARVAGGKFVHAFLAHHVGQRVQVRLDPEDKERSAAYIFDDKMDFICRAPNIRDMAAEERRTVARGVQRVHDQYTKKQVKLLRALAEKTNAAGAGETIMAWHLARAQKIEAAADAKSCNVTHSTSVLEQCGVAVMADKQTPPRTHSKGIVASRDAVRAQWAAPAEGTLPAVPGDSGYAGARRPCACRPRRTDRTGRTGRMGAQLCGKQ